MLTFRQMILGLADCLNSIMNLHTMSVSDKWDAFEVYVR